MEDEEKNALTANQVTLVTNMIVDEVFIAQLIQDETLTLTDKEQLQSIPEAQKTERASRVLGMLPRKPGGFQSLLRALRVSGQGYIADDLEKQLQEQLSMKGACSSNSATSSAVEKDVSGLKLDKGAVRLVLLGGEDRPGEVFASVEYLQIGSESWTQAQLNIPRSREFFGVAVCKGDLYIVGGLEVFGPVLTVDVLRQGRWITVQPLSVKRTDPAVTEMGGKVYVAGGGLSTILSSVESYDPDEGRWARVTDLPVPLSGAAAVSLQEKIYVSGGASEDEGSRLKTCFSYTEGQWVEVQPMLSPRFGHGVVEVNNAIYTAGGGDDEKRLNTVELFDPRENVRRWLEPMSVPRMLFGFCAHGTSLYASGGSPNSRDRLDSAEEFDTRANRWRPLPKMFRRRYGHQMVAWDSHYEWM